MALPTSKAVKIVSPSQIASFQKGRKASGTQKVVATNPGASPKASSQPHKKSVNLKTPSK